MFERIANGDREFVEFSCNGRWLSEIVHVLEIMNGSEERKERYGSVTFHSPTLTKKYMI